MAQIPDYGKYREVTESKDALARLTELAHQQKSLENDVLRAETELKAAKAKLEQVAVQEIPALMDEVGMQTFVTRDGLKVVIKEDISVKIPEGGREEAITWLEARGEGGIVKRVFLINFPKEEEAWANKFEAQLRRRKRPLMYERKKDVHPQTLKAHLRGLLSEGVDVPLEAFGAYVYRVSKIITQE